MYRLLFCFLLGIVYGMGKTPPEPNAAPAAPAARSSSTQESTMTEWRGQSSGVAAADAFLVSTPEDWQKLWKDNFAGRDVPAVDFNGHVAAVVFLGSKSTGGYGVDFLEPEISGDKTTLRYRVKSPGPGAFVTQAFTTPFGIKLYPKPAGPVDLQQTR